MSDQYEGVEVASWPVMTAVLTEDGSGTVEISGVTQDIAEASVDRARERVQDRAVEYARDKLQRPLHLRTEDPDGTWELVVHPSGRIEAMEAPPAPRGRLLGRLAGAAPEAPPVPAESASEPVDLAGMRVTVSGRPRDAAPAPEPWPVAERRPPEELPAPPPLEREGPPGKLDRRALHEVAPSGFDRLSRWVSQRLKSPDEVAEELIDERLAGRHILTRANLVAVVSPKGGPGKSTLTAILGDALSRSLPNSRVLAVDCNPGGGTLGLMAPEQRAARFTLLDLYDHRETVETRAHLQPYVAALASGLDVLAVPPDPGLALRIKPEHYTTLLHECLLPNYELILLDTSPDITSPVTQLALQKADQLVLVAEQGYLTAEVVWHSLTYMLASPAAGPDGSRATIAINKVVDNPKAGRVDELQRQLRKVHEGPQVLIPFDLDLHAAIAEGSYSLPGVRRRATRLPLKQLTLNVTERFL